MVRVGAEIPFGGAGNPGDMTQDAAKTVGLFCRQFLTAKSKHKGNAMGNIMLDVTVEDFQAATEKALRPLVESLERHLDYHDRYLKLLAKLANQLADVAEIQKSLDDRLAEVARSYVRLANRG
jgi:hypothetical protein